MWPSSFWKGMAFSSCGGDSVFFFFFTFVLDSIDPFVQFSLCFVSTKLGVKRSFKKGYRIWCTVKYILFAMFFFYLSSL